VGDDDVDAKSDELSRYLAGALAAPAGIAEFKRDKRPWSALKQSRS
jgi:hypothetical protein